MYAWYFPKDMPNSGVSAGAHRHDWESVVVWVADPAAPELIGAAASGHGGFKTTKDPQREGDRLKVEYFTSTLKNHELQFTDTLGKDYALLDWATMTEEARKALESTDFGSANVPFKDANWESNLDKAWVE